MWYIKHIKTGEILNINQEKTSIGRLGTTFVLKNDESISRKHCTFLLKQNELKIIDDGAKYGTTIKNSGCNKVTKEPTTLKDGDMIHFGCFENIWEVHLRETRSSQKRKSDDHEAIENNLSISNISKKSKGDPKAIDKFDIVIDSSDDDVPKTSKNTQRPSRQRKNVIKDYSEDILPSTSKNEATQNNSKEDKIESQKVVRSQTFYDSDEDIFATSTQKENSSEKLSSNKSGALQSKKVILDPDDDFSSFCAPKKTVNSRKRPSDDPESSGINNKIAKTTRILRNQSSSDTKAESKTMNKPSSDEVDSSVSRAPGLSSHNSRKRDIDDEIFNFDLLNKHQIKKPKPGKTQESTITDEITTATTTSPKSVKSFAFKTTNLCDKQAFASVTYDIDEDSNNWLSTKVSNMNVKDEVKDETDNSLESSNIEPKLTSIVVNIIRKDMTLDTTSDSSKSFHKQKFQESTESVKLKRLNVKDMNYCYTKDESQCSWA